MRFTIQLSAEEKKLAESSAKLHKISVEEALKRALFERIEDEYDISIAKDAFEKYTRTGNKSGPIGDLWQEL